ncbi:hypothetical protein VTJ83DRAFT_2194 [Remersonia thermophila]|uniref:Spc7 kinetochore protein domain-containing protein n=1 Tax=Remersonia thermophila TaxID=72144 RepID=A0ABR4DI58_9PEZI
MAAHEEATLPATRRTRKSIGGPSTTRRSSDKDNAALDAGSTAAAAAATTTRKKTRSKSMGPGGFDALKTGSGNRRASLAAPPRSILKPTMPLLPEIPSYKPKGPSEGTKIALRTEEEQQAAAREREERERAQLEKEIRDRRDARRKSLANRRVSFAAEATLHTFHEIDEMPDSTTSSDSTRRTTQNSHHQPPSSDPPSSSPARDVDELPQAQQQQPPRRRRRSSAVSSAFGSDDYDSDFDHAESVAEEDAIEIEGSSDEDGTIMTVEAEEMTSASSPRSAFDGDTGDSVDENLRLAARRAVTQSLGEDEEVIAGFAGWGRKNHSQDNASRGAANDNRGASGSNGHHGDDQGSDMDMEADMDMTTAAGKILYPELPSPDREEEINEDMSMDVTTALGGILSKATAFLRRRSVNPTAQQAEPTQMGEQTMDLTTAIGGIRKGRMSDVSQFDVDANEDMSMEFTTAIGGLLSAGLGKNGAQNTPSPAAGDEEDDGGDLMDMTEAVGRILPDEGEEQDQTMGMDMTVAVGGIIASASTPAARSAAGKVVMEENADEPGRSPTAAAAVAAERSGSPERPTASAADEKAAAEFSPFRGNGLRRSPPQGLPPARLSPSRSPAPPSSSPMRQSPTPSPKKNAAAQSPARTPPSASGNDPPSSSPVRNLSSPMKTTPRSPARPSLFHQDPNTGLATPHVVLTPQVRRLSGVGADRPGLGSPRVAEIFDRRESIGEAASSFVPSVPQNPRRNVAFADPRELEDEFDRERREDGDREAGQDGAINLREMIQGLSPKKNPFRGRKSLAIGSGRGLLGKRPIELDMDDDDDEEENDGVKRLKGRQGSPVKNIRLQSPPSKAETTTGRKTRPSMRPVEPADRATTPTAGSSPQRATTPRDPAPSRFFGGAMDDQPTATVDLERFSPVRPPGLPLGGDAQDGERIHLQDFLNMTSIRFMELTTTKRRHTVAPGTARESIAASKDDVSLERCVVAGACTVPMLEMYQHSCRELKKYISEGRRIVREIETETFEENPPLFREYMTATPEMRVLMDNQFKNVKTHARLLSKAMWYEWRSKLCEGLKEGLLKTAEGMDADEKLLARQESMLAEVLPGLAARREALEREKVELHEAEQELAGIDPQDLEDARAELAAVDKALADKSRRLEELKRELEEAAEGVDDLAQKKQLCLDEIHEADRIREECRGWSVDEIAKHKAQTDAVEKRTGWAIASVAGTALTMRYRREIELVFDVAALQQSSPSSRPIAIRYIGPPAAAAAATSSSSSHRRSSSRDNNIIVGKDVARGPSTPAPEKAFVLRRLRSHLRSRGPSLFPRAAPARRAPMLLRLVADAWDLAGEVEATVRRLNLTFPTVVELDGSDGDGTDGDEDDGGMEDQDPENGGAGGAAAKAAATIKSSILLAPLQTRVEVRLRLGVVVQEKALLEHGQVDGMAGTDGNRPRRRAVEVTVKPEAGVVYGEPFAAGKMTEFLAGRVASSTEGGADGGKKMAAMGLGLGWDEAVVELERRLLAKGRAGQR